VFSVTILQLTTFCNHLLFNLPEFALLFKYKLFNLSQVLKGLQYSSVTVLRDDLMTWCVQDLLFNVLKPYFSAKMFHFYDFETFIGNSPKFRLDPFANFDSKRIEAINIFYELN
jgi:hypothetical protein